MAAISSLSGPEKRYRIAVPYPRRNNSPPHEVASQDALARKLAGLLELDFVPNYRRDPSAMAGRVYYVPGHTLVRAGVGGAAGLHLDDIQDDADLFGGVVPHDFVATKAISHALLHRDTPAPEGWSHAFGKEVESATLAGFTVFRLKDARIAGERLLALGPLRIKPVRASGGRGQLRVSDRRQLDEALAGQDEDEMRRWGLVLEEHLENVETYSVGLARAGGATLAYVGTQELTPDNEERLVYGGSSLLCVRGDYNALLALPLDAFQRQAVRLARQYDAAAQRCWPGLLASRRNYDVVRGADARGRIKMGVLEQSWRAGGASYAEACALEAFHRSPELALVRACTRERYGESEHAPDDVQLIYRGDDPVTGFITKYGAIETHGHPK